jgi:hypothetical protein
LAGFGKLFLHRIPDFFDNDGRSGKPRNGVKSQPVA